MIKLKNLTKYYSSGFVKTFVLREIDLDVEAGEFVTIMGPSGAGKSTLLHILGMLDNPSSGEYYFFDKAVHKLSERQLTELHKNYIGFVFQSYHLIDDLTVYENLETPLLYKKVKGSERKSKVCDMLDRFNMVAKRDLFPNQLSGGQQQRVNIAGALASKPKLLVLDEPSTGVDCVAQEDFYELLAKFRNEQGISVIMVSHDIGVITSHADRVACLNIQLHYHGSPDSCFTPEIQQSVFGKDMKVIVHDPKCITCYHRHEDHD